MPSQENMNIKSTKVFIHNITKDGKTYIVSIAFNNKAISCKLTQTQIGLNLMDGIKALGIGSGGSFLESLSPSSADFSYADDPDAGILPRKLEILPSVLTKFKTAKSLESGRNINTVSTKTGKYTLIYDIMPQNLSGLEYMRGPIEHVTDGDTFRIHVKEGQNVGTKQTIRLTGINTTESPKDDPDFQAATDEKNKAWLRTNGFEVNDKNLKLTYKHAAESKALIESQFKPTDQGDKSKWVTVIADTYDDPDSNYPPGKDMYNRTLGNVYFPYSVPGSPYSAISINKSILANTSTTFPNQPLATPYFFLGPNGQVSSIFNVNTWWQYSPKYDESVNKIEEIKEANSGSVKDKFIKQHNLKFDKNGILVYNGEDEKVVDTKTYTVLKTDTWESIAGQFKSVDQYTTVEAILTANGMTTKYGVSASNLAGKKINIPILQKFGNTYEDYIKSRYVSNLNEIPADSEDEDYIAHIFDDRDILDGIDKSSVDEIKKLEQGGFLRIGDCSFVVPPISIRVDSISHVRQVPTLRNKTSIQTNAGHTTRVITMKLFFANENQVNGYATDMPKLNETYYRNGLRPLIAQFKKAPFLPIENVVINNTHQIYSVAFKDLQLNTVQGFPGCVEAYLSLYEFDHTIYMPHEEYFSGTFNWKLFRWYYQRSMQEKNALLGRTYLEPVNVKDDSVKFFIPDESVLGMRQQALRDLNMKIDPTLFAKSNTDKDTEAGKLLIDTDAISAAKSEFNNFKLWMARCPMNKYGRLYDSKGVFDPIELAGITDAKEKELYKNAVLDCLNTLYDFQSRYDTVKRSTGGKGMGNTTASTTQFKFMPNNISAIVLFLNKNGYSVSLQDARLVMTKTSNERSKDGKAISSDTASNYNVKYDAGGAFVLDLQSTENKMIVKKTINGHNIVDPSDILTVKQIENGGLETKESFINYQSDIEELNYKAHLTEADIPSVPFEIGEIFTTSISSQMSNTFGTQQLLSQEAPVFQFLGAQDSTINIQFVTKDKTALRNFHKLMWETQRLSREYRVAITSGVLTIKNNMLSLLGGRDFTITALSVQTNETDKESFIINMSLIVFDKTQRMREELDFNSISQTIPEDFESFKKFTAKKRNSEGFEYGVMDIRLKELEIYPDLELPTYAEANAALPFLNIVDVTGNKFMHLPNPTGAKFVDPDFYIRVGETHRDYVHKSLGEETPMLYLKDQMGFEAVEYGPEPGQQTMEKPNVNFSQETQDFISENLESVNFGNGTMVGEVFEGPLGQFNDYSNKVIDTSVPVKTPGAFDKVFGSASVGSYYGPDGKYYRLDISNKQEVLKHAEFAINAHIPSTVSFKLGDGIKVTVDQIFSPPTDSEVISWYSDEADVTGNKMNGQITSLRNKYLSKPSKAEISKFMYMLVKYYFPNHPSDANKISSGAACSTYMYGPNFISAPEITQEKILNAFKAMIDLESDGWTQLVEKGGTLTPYSNTTGGNFAVGMGQINIPTSGIVNTMSEARRAAWDWRYNLELSIKSFALRYNQCVKGSGGEAKNPLDYAIIAHNSPAWANTKKFPLPKDSKYYNWVMKRFTTKYGADRAYFEATPDKLFDPSLMTKTTAENYLRNIIKEILSKPTQKGGRYFSDPSSEVKAYIEKMNNPLYSNAKVLTVDVSSMVINKLDLKNREYAFAKDTAKYRGQKSPSMVGKINVAIFDPSNQFNKAAEDKELYSFVKGPGDPLQDSLAQHIEFRFDTVAEAFDYTSKFLLIKETAYAAYKRSGTFEAVNWNEVYSIEDIDSYKAVEVAATLRQEEFTDVLSNDPSKIPETYRSSFRDILDYDQRGRLLRAFPTFQLFLIDEGRWMAWHKMYDNFYGYASITSIDVMKDRRMAADTAIIEMTNVYSNLTTQDSDISYGQWEWKLSDLIFGDETDKTTVWNTIWGLPTEQMEAARREQLDSLVLKPGARISLRMGYGANAYNLPVVFNGTITEMNAEEIITIVAQSDGIELTNKLNKQPDDTTDPGMFAGIKEPRQMICEILTSKGGWFANIVNELSKGAFFNTHPLGIVHFGNQILPSALTKLAPDIFGVNTDYGEAGLNVYCGAGYNTFSQWLYTHGEKKGEMIGMDWGSAPLPSMKGDEPNILIYLFDKTPWDIFQIYSSVCPDYIATVLPFEYRSTLFFGKPWWGVVDKYEYQYRWDDVTDSLIREPIGAYRKTLSQFKFYDSDMDIVKNNITATDEYMYTNVIGVYNEADGAKKTAPIQADTDIYPEKQKTAIVHIPIKASAWGTNYWTQEKYARDAATSSLRDFIKEMYQGELVVLGDPTAKPYDTMYILDSSTDMNGNAEMKRVTHHFSFDTGFISVITPDCVTVIDDPQGISLLTWFASFQISMFSYWAGRKILAKTWKSFLTGPMAHSLRKYGVAGVEFIIKDILIDSLPDAAARSAAVFEGDALLDAIRYLGLKPGDFDLNDANAIKRLFGMSKYPLLSVPVKIGDEVWIALGKALKPFKEIYANPGEASNVVDNLWKASGWLDKKHLFGEVTHKVTFVDAKGNKRVVAGVLADLEKLKKEGETIAETVDATAGLARRFGNATFRTTSSIAKGVVKPVTKITAKSLRSVVTIAKAIGLETGIGIVAEVGLTIITAGLIEKYARYLQSRQAVTILPLKYRGKTFVAGINGHKGMVYGDTPGKVDSFLAGAGFLGGTIDVVYGVLGIDAPTYEPLGTNEVVEQRENDR